MRGHCPIGQGPLTKNVGEISKVEDVVKLEVVGRKVMVNFWFSAMAVAKILSLVHWTMLEKPTVLLNPWMML